jgi:hypothetical protein
MILAGVLLAPRAAHADPASDADALITKGIALREKGRDDEALDAFRDALARSPTARARAQTALAEQALGMWVLAEADLTAALSAQGDAWIAKNRAALDRALLVIRKRVATLEVRGAEHADVLVDGVKIGSGAGPFRVEAGRRALEVRAPGFQPTTRTIDLPPGGVARETVTLVAVANAAPEPPAPPASPPEKPAPHPVAPRGNVGSGQRVLGWAFVGTGAALAGAGAVSLVVRNGQIEDYNKSCPGLGASQPPSCAQQISSADTWMTVAIVTFIGGGVLAAGGGVLLATSPHAAPATSTAASPTLACSPALAPGSTGLVTCAGTFLPPGLARRA